MSLLTNELQDTYKENIQIIVVDIDVIYDVEKEYISQNLVEISKGKGSSYPAKIIAKKLINILERQTENNKVGLPAEFLQTVIIRNQGFEQEHLFINLEENSAKKGFDGLFKKDGKIWILESKSSYTLNQHMNKHKVTIDRAYKGISKSLSGQTSNDPWENAVSHAKSANPSDSLVKKLEQFSIDYVDEKFVKIQDSNLLLGSSVIANDISIIEKDIGSVQNYLQNHVSNQEIVIVMNLKSIDIFMEILEEIANG